VKIWVVAQQVGETRTGVGTYGAALVPGLVAAGVDVTVVGRGGTPWPGVRFEAVAAPGWDPSPEGWVSFARAAGRRVAALAAAGPRPDVVHFLDAREALAYRPIPGVLAVGTIHDDYLAAAPAGPAYWRARYTDWPRRWVYHRVARRLERRALARLDRLLANSDWVRRSILETYAFPGERARTVHLGLPPAPPPAPGPRRPEVLFVGVNFQRKGLPTLLRALVRVRRAVPDVRLTVIGDHPTRPALEALARDLGVADRVTFAGLLPHAEVLRRYAGARVLALPSEVEGFGLTLLEAMQRGVAVVGTTRGGSAELVTHGTSGLLVPPGDVDALAAALVALCTDDALHARLVAAGGASAARFTAARMVEATLAAYRGDDPPAPRAGGTVAVIVHWRDAEATLGCVATLRGEDARIVVVDNGGAAPLAKRLAALAPEATLVPSAENLGYAGGANLGIRHALAAGADVVLLLNDDVRVHPGAVAAGRAALAADPRIAVVGPRVLARDAPGRLWLAWGDVAWGADLVALHGAGAPDGPPYAAGRDADWVAGCALWLRGEALRRVGLFDEAFFAYHEEVDWCARARAAGWRVVYAPEVIVTHGGRGSGGAAAAVRVRKYLTARNLVLFARKHGDRARRLRVAAALAVSLPLQLLWHLPRGSAGGVWAKIRGVRDALGGRRPPFEALGLK